MLVAGFLLLGGGLTNGCAGDETLTNECPPSACPDLDCDEEIPCRGDESCPSGSVCRTDRCGVEEFRAIDPTLLIKGFATPEFDLTRAAPDGDSVDSATRYQFTAPSGAERVVCGVLTCKPNFSHGNATRVSLHRIENAARCLQRSHVFSTPASTDRPVFTFQLTDLRESPRLCEASPLGLGVVSGRPLLGYLPIETLQLGCWAEDQSHVVAATRLQPLDVGDLPEGSSTLRSSCQGAPDASWCNLPGDVGTCSNGRCDYTMPPSASGQTSLGAGGSGPAAPVPGAVTDCGAAPNGASCRRPEAEVVGQCLSGRCLRPTRADYTKPLAISNCATESAVTDWLNCYPSPVLGFGTCWGNACRLRCRGDEDCVAALDDAEVPGSGGAAGASGDVRPEHCQRKPGNFLGVCVIH